jgi:hypothetical protein
MAMDTACIPNKGARRRSLALMFLFIIFILIFLGSIQQRE